MALQLTKELPSDVSGNYNRIISVQIDWSNNFSVIQVGLYKDETARNAGKTPLLVENYRVPSSRFPFTDAALLGNDCRIPAYTYLKTLASFIGAVDC